MSRPKKDAQSKKDAQDEAIARKIKEMVDAAPPLTAEQRVRLRQLLGTDSARGTRPPEEPR